MNPPSGICRSKMTTGDRGRGLILTTAEAGPMVIPHRQFTLDTLFILYPLFDLDCRFILNTGQIDLSVHIEYRAI
jgi:hypothetical protein